MDILNLPKWEIIETEEGHEEYTFHIRYTVTPPACPVCGVMFPKVQKWGGEEQPFRDTPIHGKRVRLIVHRKKWRCNEAEKPHYFLEKLEEFDDKRRMTTRCLEDIQRKALDRTRTFTSVAQEFGVDTSTVKHIFDDYIKALDAGFVLKTPRWLGMDEIAILGGTYGVFTNVEEGRLLDILDGRSKGIVARRLMDFPHRDTIEIVTMDMWEPYRQVAHDLLPQAKIIVDKFHVVRYVDRAMQAVRLKIREGLSDKQRKQLMHDRFLLAHRKHRLKPEKVLLLETWLDRFPELRAAYDLKESFHDLYDSGMPEQVARVEYAAWKERIPESITWAFEQFLGLMDNWETEIFNYFDSQRVTNAYTEAMNGLIRVTNRIGRGYSFPAIRAKMLYAPDLHRTLLRPRKKIAERPDPLEGVDLETADLTQFQDFEIEEVEELSPEESAAFHKIFDGISFDQLTAAICEFIPGPPLDSFSTKERRKWKYKKTRKSTD